jgi:hypothetical protein
MELTFDNLKKLNFTSGQVVRLLDVPEYLWVNRSLREDLAFLPEWKGPGHHRTWTWEQIVEAEKYLRTKPPRKRKKDKK